MQTLATNSASNYDLEASIKTTPKNKHWSLQYNLNRLFNFSIALILLIICMPVMIIIFVAIKCLDGGRIFYRGERLGLNKQPFTMYKFRTLIPEAESIIGPMLLSRKSTEHTKLETKIGGFLRDCRLDELPQLINVLRGEMNIVGPRPVRPIIYNNLCKDIRGYDSRFDVKPGIIGYAQVFTPHGAPKRIRSYINYIFLKKNQNPIRFTLLCAHVFAILSLKVILRIKTYISNDIVKQKLLNKYVEKRLRQRKNLKNAYLYSESEANFIGKIADINDEAVSFYSTDKIDITSVCPLVRFEILEKNRSNRHRKRIARCKCETYEKISCINDPSIYRYVMKFEPITPLNEYLINKYFLHNSISM